MQPLTEQATRALMFEPQGLDANGGEFYYGDDGGIFAGLTGRGRSTAMMDGMVSLLHGLGQLVLPGMADSTTAPFSTDNPREVRIIQALATGAAHP